MESDATPPSVGTGNHRTEIGNLETDSTKTTGAGKEDVREGARTMEQEVETLASMLENLDKITGQEDACKIVAMKPARLDGRHVEESDD